MHKVLGHNVADIVSATFTEDTASNILKAKGHKVEENQKTWKSFPRFQKN